MCDDVKQKCYQAHKTFDEHSDDEKVKQKEKLKPKSVAQNLFHGIIRKFSHKALKISKFARILSVNLNEKILKFCLKVKLKGMT